MKIWMIFQDQDDCAKRLVCEVQAKASRGQLMTETEKILVASFPGQQKQMRGEGEGTQFNLAAMLGRKVNSVWLPWFSSVNSRVLVRQSAVRENLPAV